MRSLCTVPSPVPAACSISSSKGAQHAAFRGAKVAWSRFVGVGRLYSLSRPHALRNSPCPFRTSGSRSRECFCLKCRSRRNGRSRVVASASRANGAPPSERNSPASNEKNSIIETVDEGINPENNTRGQGPRNWLARLRERFVVDSMAKFMRGILMFLRAGVTAFLLLFTVGLIGNMAVALKPSSEYPSAAKVAYSDFLQSVDKGEVMKVTFIEGSKKVLYQVQTPGQEEAEIKMARVVDDPTLVNRLHSNGVHFAAISTPVGEQIKKFIFTTLALWLPLIPLFYLLRRSMGDRNNNAMNKQLSSGERVGVTFKDVAGVDAAKEELMEVVDGLRDPARFAKLGARLPSGVLLSGPPGTGKTLLARAVAGEANVPFFAISASEFVELFVGKGAQRVRQLFKEARKVAPAVIFIDEIDAVGARRGVMSNDERDQTLNQLLAEMDGFHIKGQEAAEKPVIVLAATNRPTVLDPALMRPGRFSRKVFVDVPDEKGRIEILKIHMGKIQIKSVEEREYMLRTLASATKGCSGAELANIVNEAALLAARRSPPPVIPPGQEAAEGDYDVTEASVTMEDFLEAFRREKGGIGKKGGILENVFLKAVRSQLQQGEKIEVDADGRPIRAITL